MEFNRFYKRCAIVALFGLLILPLTGLSEAAMAQTTAILRVDIDVTTSGDGSAWGNNNAIKYLQDARDEAFDLIENELADKVEIWVANGTYYPDEGSSPTNNDRDETFTLLNKVEIYGGFHGDGGEDDLTDRDIAGNDPAILSGDLQQNDGANFTNYGDNSYHVVTALPGLDVSAILDGFTVRGGSGEGTGPQIMQKSGGGIVIGNIASTTPSNPIIRNCIITENKVEGLNSTVSYGGGIAVRTGAVSPASFPTPEIRNCTIIGNQGGQGGGLFANRAHVRVLNCTFAE